MAHAGTLQDVAIYIISQWWLLWIPMNCGIEVYISTKWQEISQITFLIFKIQILSIDYSYYAYFVESIDFTLWYHADTISNLFSGRYA